MLLLLAASLGACTASKDTGTGEVDPAVATDIVAEPTPDIATVLRVTWRTEEAVRGQVLFGADTDYALATPEEAVASTEHTALLLGNTADQDVHLQILSTREDGSVATTGDVIARTGSLPSELPLLHHAGAADPIGGYLALPILGAWYGPTFVDTEGNYVWYHHEERAGYTVQRVRLSRDGQSVLYNAVWLSDLTPNGELVRVSLDGATVTSWPVPRTTHDFTELPDGTLAAIYSDIRKVNGEDVYGDAIAEVATDGTVTTLWSAFDTYDPVKQPALNSSDASWTHFNVLHYDPADEAYYVGIRNFNSIVKLDRATGTPVWTLGGWNDSYTWGAETRPFTGQHGFQFLDDGHLLVFDNGPAEDASSAAVSYTLDEAGHTITEDWEHTHDPAFFVWAMGDVERRSDGGTRVTWSTSGAVEQLTATGEQEWEISADFGTLFGYSSWHPNLYAADVAPY